MNCDKCKTRKMRKEWEAGAVLWKCDICGHRKFPEFVAVKPMPPMTKAERAEAAAKRANGKKGGKVCRGK